MSTHTLAVLVPVYNEAPHLAPLVQSIAPVLDDVCGKDNWHFVFVNNGSTDDSASILTAIAATLPRTIVLTLPAPNYGVALKNGFEHAQADYIYIINVDFWDKAFLHWGWLNRSQYDLMLGSKRADPTINHLSPYRQFLSWGLNTLLQLFFGFVGRDTHGQKMLKTSTLLPHAQKCVMQRGQFDTELVLRALRAGLWIAEAPVPIVEIRKQRNWMIRKIYNNVIDIFKLRAEMAKVPWSHSVRYHRWAREDVELGRRVSWHHSEPQRAP
ncbi:glycosyltransferase family 2 protein [Desulfovibrio sp. OttesenSCG-928-M14]|nr:glycosyltransferase family 2 protein [Desulfovibrio sp. OttesenSCG-928-M14]